MFGAGLAVTDIAQLRQYMSPRDYAELMGLQKPRLKVIKTPEDCAYEAGRRAAYYEMQRAKAGVR